MRLKESRRRNGVCGRRIRTRLFRRGLVLRIKQRGIWLGLVRKRSSVDESNQGTGKEGSAVASALVLYHDAQDVWQGSDAREDADACAEIGLGRHRNGSGTRRE